MALDTYVGSKPILGIKRKVHELFDLLNGRNPLILGNVAPLSSQNLPVFLRRCKAVSKQIFALTNKKGNFLRTSPKKTVFWGLLSLSIRAIVTEFLTYSSKPYKYIIICMFC